MRRRYLPLQRHLPPKFVRCFKHNLNAKDQLELDQIEEKEQKKERVLFDIIYNQMKTKYDEIVDKKIQKEMILFHENKKKEYDARVQVIQQTSANTKIKYETSLSTFQSLCLQQKQELLSHPHIPSSLAQAIADMVQKKSEQELKLCKEKWDQKYDIALNEHQTRQNQIETFRKLSLSEKQEVSLKERQECLRQCAEKRKKRRAEYQEKYLFT
jgi:hypothetical protein